MERQVIVAIGREFGSEGHEIAALLAERMGITLYDRKILDEIAKENTGLAHVIEKYDERPKNPFISRTVNGHSNSIEENIARMQFEYIRNKAQEGESFVVVGRCAEAVLNEVKCLTSVFIIGDMEHKIEHVMKKFELGKSDAIKKIKRHDITRKMYHNTYSDIKWGDSRGYDMCINSSRIGVEGTVEIIEKYVNMKMQQSTT